eukprot:g4128.t1
MADDWLIFGVGSLAAVLATLAGVAQASFVGSAFESLRTGATGYAAVRRLLLLFVTSTGLHFTSNTLLSMAINRLASQLHMRMFAAILSQDMAFFDRRTEKNVPVGVLVSDDVKEMCSALKHLLQNGLTASAGVVGGTLSLFSISSKLSLLALFCIPTTTAAFNLFAAVVRRQSRAAKDREGRSMALVGETVQNIKVVQAYGGEAQEVRRFGDEVEKALGLKHMLAMMRGLFFASAGMAFHGVTLVTLYIGSEDVRRGVMTDVDIK